tara:strand:- start:232 stop:609 length:378 start_codon:yes stop_codon:yes gene_type:complete
MNPNKNSITDLSSTAPETDEPVFKEPWEATAFALVLALHRGEHFSWQEWGTALAKEIERAQPSEHAVLEDDYYQHWLTALEKLLAEKGLTTEESLLQRRNAWRDAYLNTPHGQPVSLPTDSTPGD